MAASEAIPPISIERLDGELLVLDGLALARGFFRGDPSSIARGSYDSLAGESCRDMIMTADIETINRTMRGRSSHRSWAALLNCRLEWLAAIDPTLDLIASEDSQWAAVEGERLVRTALIRTVGPYRGPSVATKVLHLKRPRLFPVLDDLVAVMLGMNMPSNAPPARRVAMAMQLVLHLRAEGRRNLASLEAIGAALREEDIERPVLRILDAILWFSHPAAGVPGATREFRVGAARPG
jgi:hypothetical protein